MSTHQRRRITEMLTNLLKDLGEIGVSIGGDGTDIKVVNTSLSLKISLVTISTCTNIHFILFLVCL